MGQCLAICGGGEKEAPQQEMQKQPQQHAEQKQQHQGGGGGGGGGKAAPSFGGPRDFPPASSAGDAQRAQAGVHAKRRGELLSQSQEAYKSGDKAAAKKLSDEGKREGAAMDACNLAACEAYFAGNNANKGQGEIDLHGLYVEEAVRKLEERLAVCRRNNADQLIVIVGRGNHSKDNVAKIKPAMQKFVADHKLKVAVDSPNPGCMTIFFGQGDSGYVHPPGGRSDGCMQQ